jgi:AcrR family transcriptional regulator
MEHGIRQQQKNKTRREILSAAKGLFVDLGYERATTRRIAEMADVGTGTVFAHFADKSEILRALLLQEVDDVLAAAKSEVAEETGAVDALLMYAERLYAYYREQWDLSRELLRNVMFNARDYQGQIAAFGEELAVRLRIDAPGMTAVDREVLAQCLFANYMMTLIHGLGLPDSTLESWIEQLERSCRLLVRPFADAR